MAIAVEKIVETALGPWGLAVGVGVAAVTILRRRNTREAHHDGARSRRHMLSPVAAAAGVSAGRIRHAVKGAELRHPRKAGTNMLSGAVRAWDNLYTEAKTEVESRYQPKGSAVAEHLERSDDIVRPEHSGAAPEGTEATQSSSSALPSEASTQSGGPTDAGDANLLPPGGRAPVTGRYLITGPRGGQTDHAPVTMEAGGRLPPTPEAGQRYRLMLATDSSAD